jgi:hypothetical protein
MVDEHEKELEKMRSDISERDKKLQKAYEMVDELTIGRSFADSEFVRDELILTPAKARVIYGNHFAIEDGKIVGYDKPAGKSDRTMLVDAKGNSMSFDGALKHLVNVDSERDSLLKSKLGVGASSKTTNEKPKLEPTEIKGIQRITVALNSKK